MCEIIFILILINVVVESCSEMLQWWNNDSLLKADAHKFDFHGTEDSKRDVRRDSKKSVDEGALREWSFRVRVDCLSPGEIVGVTGNTKALGHWDCDRMLLLKRDSNEENFWVGKAELPVNMNVEYRYCTCIVVEPEISKLPKRQYVIRRWESFSPRIIKTADDFVEVSETFGYYNGKEYNIAKGWLTCASIIHLKLFNNPIQLWKRKLQERKIYVKVTPVNLTKARDSHLNSIVDDTLSLETFEEHSDLWPITEIAVLNDADHQFRSQEQFGRVYNEGDYMIFQINVLAPDTIAYLIDFYTYSSRCEASDPPYHIGFTCILPSVMKTSEGQVVVPITSVKHQPIGQITVEYLIVKPIADYSCTMQQSMQTNWKDSWTGLDVGHRGVGSSFELEQHKCADVRENTIASLKSAASHGADFVEFDVQLSRDLVPVIYHDFYVSISMKKKKDADESEMLQLPLKELSVDQLHLLKLYHVEEGRNRNSKFFNEDLEEHQPFPTLKNALEVLDTSVGFNVELKWTMKRADGTFELNHPFDLNLFVDSVLKDVLNYAGPRPIVFSCFHPDICTMIQLKQNKYPVVFLTQCITPKYLAYYDPRCLTVAMAVHFAVSTNILGINVHTEELLRDSSQINLVRAANLVLFCWGEDNNNPDTIKCLKEMGLHGIIYDKIDKYSNKEVKESIFRLEARESERIRFKEAAEKAERESNASNVPPESASKDDREPDFKSYVLDMDKVHAVSTRVSGSTMSGLSIWSVDEFGNTDGDQRSSAPVYDFQSGTTRRDSKQ